MIIGFAILSLLLVIEPAGATTTSYIATDDADITYQASGTSWFNPSSNFEVLLEEPNHAIGHSFTVDPLPAGAYIKDASLSYGLGSTYKTLPPESRVSTAGVRLGASSSTWDSAIFNGPLAGSASVDDADIYGFMTIPLDPLIVAIGIEDAQGFDRRLIVLTSDINDVGFGVRTLGANLTPGGFFYKPEYAATLTIDVAFTGDFNADGFVSQADLDLVLLNWGDSTVPPEWIASDQFDGVQVSQNELDGVLLNWGKGTPPARESVAIPEPGIAVLLLAGGPLALRRRR